MRRANQSGAKSSGWGHYGKTLPEIETRLQQVVAEVLLDGDNFVRGNVNVRTMQPFTPRDVAHLKLEDMFTANAAIPFAWKKLIMNYEDADTATGDYLIALIHQFRVTSSPSVQTAARRTYNAVVTLCRNASRTNPYGRGWLPKPHNGIRDVSAACETSVDQYGKITHALDLYRRTMATPAEAKQCSAILVAFADWWIEHSYTTGYFGYCCWWYRTNYPHAISFFLYLLALAHSLTGRKIYDREFRQMLARRQALVIRRSDAANAGNLTIESLERLYELKPRQRRIWLAALKSWWNWSRADVSREGYCTRTLPLPNNPRVRLNAGVRVAASGAIACRFLDDPRAIVRWCDALLLKHNHHKMFCTCHPSNARLPKQFAFWKNRFGGHTHWLQAYWRLRLAEKEWAS